MNDTSPEIQALQHRLMMERSGEERFLMGVSMCQMARRIVLSSLPEELSEAERRIEFFLRLYGSDFDAATRAAIVERIRRAGRG